MYVHMFLFVWKEGVTQAQIERSITEIRAFQGTIAGLDSTDVGVNISPKASRFGLGGVMRFVDEAAYAAYVDHPLHQALLTWLVPLIEAVEVDFIV